MASHEEIWDDSALVNSWNEALAEYKKYHSIHAEGAALPEGVAGDFKDQNAKPSATEEVEEGEDMEEDGAVSAVEVDVGPVDTVQNGQQPAAPAGPTTTTAASLPGPGPQLMLGSVQDEELKKLLMSWYYAGYYTGLYDGKQKAMQEQAKK